MASNTKTLQALALGAALIFAAGGAEAEENPEYLPRLLNGGFHCGKTFITFPNTDSDVWTLRKADIVRVFWPKPRRFTVISKMVGGDDTFPIKVSPAFIQPVVTCLN